MAELVALIRPWRWGSIKNWIEHFRVDGAYGNRVGNRTTAHDWPIQLSMKKSCWKKWGRGGGEGRGSGRLVHKKGHHLRRNSDSGRNKTRITCHTYLADMGVGEKNWGGRKRVPLHHVLVLLLRCNTIFCHDTP